MTIKEERLKVLTQAFGKLHYMHGWLAEVQETSAWHSKVKTYGVNWGCKGVQSTTFVYAMMIQLKICRDIAEMLNDLHIIVDTTDDEFIATKEDYDMWGKKMMDSIELGEVDKIKQFLIQ